MPTTQPIFPMRTKIWECSYKERIVAFGMNVIKIKRNDVDYDKSKSVKSESVGYISKKHFKSLECKENIQGFFCFKKGRSKNRIGTEKNSFDLKNKKSKFSFIRGYVKSIDGSFYALTTRNILPFILMFILLLGMLFAMKSCTGENPIRNIWQPSIDQSIYSNEKNNEEAIHKEITICGFTDWTVQSGKTENIPILLQNPDGNPCYFTFQITLQDGTQLYQSSHVPPGSEIRKVTLSQPLEKGTYTAFISIFTNEIETGTPMNSAKTKITINAI